MTGTPASWQVAQNVLRSISPLCTVWWERSEEHTSELQSQSNLVCRLLLEKNRTSAHKLLNSHGLGPHLHDRCKGISRNGLHKVALHAGLFPVSDRMRLVDALASMSALSTG